MFSIRARSTPIDITTFELDINLGAATAAGPLDVEVYSLLDGYELSASNPSAWTSISNTVAVPVPGEGMGIIIPVQDFTTVSMLANELRSFYITMKGPFLDNTSDALTNSGELDKEYESFSIDVGSGLAEYSFPAAFDTTISPKFAGIIHYKDASADCSSVTANTAETIIEYKFLFDDAGVDDLLITNVNEATKVFFDAEIGEYLKDYASRYRLEVSGTPSTESEDRQTSKLFNVNLFRHLLSRENLSHSFPPFQLGVRKASLLAWY